MTILMVELFYFGLVGLVLSHAGHRVLAPLRGLGSAGWE